MIRMIRIVAPAVALVVLTACGGADGADGADRADGAAGAGSEGPYIVATTDIWADVTAAVACDGSFDIATVVPPGADPHGYEPSLRDRELLDGAALIVANGLGLEELLDDTLTTVEREGVPVFRVGDRIADAGADIAGDPHVWFDPDRVRIALGPLGDAVVAAGADAAATDECLAETDQALAAVDEDMESILATVPADRRTLVTNHDSLRYFADRYGFTVLGTVLPSTSTLTEASPGQLVELGDAIAAAGVPAIFTESLEGNRDAARLAERLGVDVVELYTGALGPPGSGAGTYLDLLRHDARAIAAALGDPAGRDAPAPEDPAGA